jgi:hypothetical protein
MVNHIYDRKWSFVGESAAFVFGILDSSIDATNCGSTSAMI